MRKKVCQVFGRNCMHSRAGLCEALRFVRAELHPPTSACKSCHSLTALVSIWGKKKYPCLKGFVLAPASVSKTVASDTGQGVLELSCQPWAHKPESSERSAWRCVLARQAYSRGQKPAFLFCLKVLLFSYLMPVGNAHKGNIGTS